MNDTQFDSQSTEQAEVFYEQALDLFEQKRYSECLTLLDQAVCLQRDNAYIYYSRGNTRYELKDFRGAAAEFLWALRCAPYYFSASMNLGNTYLALGQYEKSLAQYLHALPLEPECAVAHYNLGGAYHALGRLPEALNALNRAIELDPVFAGCYLNRANVLSRLGRHDEALADYRQALALEPNDSNTAWTVAWAQFGREGLRDAEAGELERVSHLDPAHYTSHCCLAVVAFHDEDPQAALRHLEQAMALAPKEWDTHFWIGLLAAIQGETEIARQAITASLELGLPLMLLTPLYWLQSARTDFYESYARGVLLHHGI